MSAVAIAQILATLVGAIPELTALFTQASNGATVTEAQVDAVLSKYAIDRAALLAAIAQADPPTV
jgi:hypothetical protein